MKAHSVARSVAGASLIMNDKVFRYPTRDSFTCGDNQVHVWRINLEQATNQVEACELILSIDERERAKRFYKARDRRQFIVARGSLRTLLAHYLNLQPCQIRFSYGAHGKPALNEALKNRLAFNLSHSGNLALVAVACDGEVGIDLEAIDKDLDVVAIAKAYFTPQECAEIRTATADKQHSLFYRYWTLREAYLKALGLGITARLYDPEVLRAATQTLLRSEGDFNSQENVCWQSHQLKLRDYAAALVTQGQDKEIHCWQLPEVF